jgi:hypothetical protein
LALIYKLFMAWLESPPAGAYSFQPPAEEDAAESE